MTSTQDATPTTAPAYDSGRTVFRYRLAARRATALTLPPGSAFLAVGSSGRGASVIFVEQDRTSTDSDGRMTDTRGVEVTEPTRFFLRVLTGGTVPVDAVYVGTDLKGRDARGRAAHVYEVDAATAAERDALAQREEDAAAAARLAASGEGDDTGDIGDLIAASGPGSVPLGGVITVVPMSTPN